MCACGREEEVVEDADDQDAEAARDEEPEAQDVTCGGVSVRGAEERGVVRVQVRALWVPR